MKIFFVFSLLVLSPKSFASDEPPAIYVDKGACPIECCKYAEWKANADTSLYDSIDGKKVLTTILRGSKVKALTGEVHAIPAKVKVSLQEGETTTPSDMKDGEEIYLLRPQGEGFWKIWRKGKVVSEVPEVWESKTPEYSWWIKLKLKNGTVGWSKEFENFDGKSTCD